MKTLTFHVNYDNQIYTYKAGTEVMIFDYGVHNEIDRKYSMKALKEYVALVYELYLSDSNDTPLGKLCDYVAQRWKKLKNKGRYDILEEFYLSIF
ncbi:MAG: hypothetical protein OSJ61_07625 [Lachnospiraceae bacterium]|nr:hypothetical protein [Lachnospiraceae bacterium]